MSASVLIEPIYLLACVSFILALKRMSRPQTAASGMVFAGFAMAAAIAVTCAIPGMENFALMGVAILLGGGAAYYAAKKVAMTGMPQMVAIYNGMGGGAAGAIGALELLRGASGVSAAFSALGGIIGAVSITGSVIAFLKLQGWMRERPIVYPLQKASNLALLGAAIIAGALCVFRPSREILAAFFILSAAFGFLMTIPIGGADMPVVISLYNALTGVAVAMDGFAIGNFAMMVAGTLVGAAGSLLTLLMAKAMNRSIPSILFGAFGAVEQEGGDIAGSLKPIEASDAALMLGYAAKVIVVPGYGLAVAQAQQKVKELMDSLESKGVAVKFGIHPVAGRMPGHMDVLLAEAKVPYDRLFDRDEINAEFSSADVALVIGANDVVNPSAHRTGSPLYGMPILDAEQAKNVIVLKRGKGKGFAGIENELFYKDNTRMLYGDAQESVSKLIQALKDV
ncbi:MAG: NAD(P)(+) transhydrogenase (Re/Si-specific) subunit beta [Elusimicrobia bacterium]|nr:NAD(P)(+) transhydrogenase (Re/Si-specific) subunit beta [Elusimicrobiota bacterium]MDE2312966.1 NAD(P)(+) transhydrogenase (Re/Si-specific) subunit beta [Elusimicrobiota bacterium]